MRVALRQTGDVIVLRSPAAFVERHDEVNHLARGQVVIEVRLRPGEPSRPYQERVVPLNKRVTKVEEL